MLENNNLPDGNEFHGNEEETQLKRKITCLIEKKQFKEVYDLIEVTFQLVVSFGCGY